MSFEEKLEFIIDSWYIIRTLWSTGDGKYMILADHWEKCILKCKVGKSLSRIVWEVVELIKEVD